jgi:hypothetical protein
MFPKLKGLQAERDISDKTIASSLGIAIKTFRNKKSGITDFTWREACAIQQNFFPDISKDELFKRKEDA